MRIELKIVSLLAIALLLCACQPKEKDIYIAPHEPKLVVFSQVIPNTVMIVALAKSFPILTSGYDPSGSMDSALLAEMLVTDATVVITYQDKTDTLLNLGKGVYTSVFIPQFVDETYHLSVVDNKTNLRISASEKMLPEVNLKTVAMTGVSDGSFKLDYTFDDPAGTNWYMINVYHQVDTNKIDSSDFQVNNLFGKKSNQLAHTAFFSDYGFVNPEITGEFIMEGIDTSISKDFIITLSNISEQYYSYLDKRKKSQNIFTEIFKEAINYPTNVQGGYGFFLTHHPGIKYIHLP